MSKKKALRRSIGVALILLGLSWYIPGVAAETYGAILKTRLHILSQCN